MLLIRKSQHEELFALIFKVDVSNMCKPINNESHNNEQPDENISQTIQKQRTSSVTLIIGGLLSHFYVPTAYVQLKNLIRPEDNKKDSFSLTSVLTGIFQHFLP